MRRRLVILGILGIVIIVGIIAFIASRSQTNQELQDVTTQNTTIQRTVTVSPTEFKTSEEGGTARFTSKDQTFYLEFPPEWHLTDTTPKQGNGQFGPITDAAVIATFRMSQAGGPMPEDSAKIDVEIMQNTANATLDQVVPCQLKAVTCEVFAVPDDIRFKRSREVLNTGMVNMVVATVYKGKIYRATGLISTGPNQEKNALFVEGIINNFQFTE
jgi:hypothetical protein